MLNSPADVRERAPPQYRLRIAPTSGTGQRNRVDPEIALVVFSKVMSSLSQTDSTRSTLNSPVYLAFRPLCEVSSFVPNLYKCRI